MFRRLLDWLRLLFGISALFFPFIVLILAVLPPIDEAVLLWYYYTPEEIARDNLRVVQIVARREIVFSNGERRPYETMPKLFCTGIALGLLALWFPVMCWGCAWLNRRFPPPWPGEKRDGIGRTTAEPGAAADGGA